MSVEKIKARASPRQKSQGVMMSSVVLTGQENDLMPPTSKELSMSIQLMTFCERRLKVVLRQVYSIFKL